MSSSVIISRSPCVLVAPAETLKAAAGDISLSSYDKVAGPVPVTVLFVFEHPIQEPVESIKRGVSQALVHYYPIAGRFGVGASSFSGWMGSLQLSRLAALDITIKPSLIQRIKDNYAAASMNHNPGGRQCTVFEAVAAVLWRCRTRAIRSAPDALAVLTFAVNARKHVGAKEGYYGNCVVTRMVTASSGAVANGDDDMLNLVKTIQRAKDGSAPPDLSDIVKLLQQLDPYNILGTTNWRNIGLEGLDFGSGRPARVKYNHTAVRCLPLCIICVPCKDDYSVLSVCVKEEHAAAFLRELQDMHLNYI